MQNSTVLRFGCRYRGSSDGATGTAELPPEIRMDLPVPLKSGLRPPVVVTHVTNTRAARHRGNTGPCDKNAPARSKVCNSQHFAREKCLHESLESTELAPSQ